MTDVARPPAYRQQPQRPDNEPVGGSPTPSHVHTGAYCTTPGCDRVTPPHEEEAPVWWLEIQQFNGLGARHFYGNLVAPGAKRHSVEQTVTTQAVAKDLELEIGDETERFGHVAVLVARAIELFEELAAPGAELFLGSRVTRLSTRDPFTEAQHLWTRSCPV